MRKNYIPPCAELVTFLPLEGIASDNSWSWIWGTTDFHKTASMTGNLTIYGPEDDSWNTDKRSDKPY